MYSEINVELPWTSILIKYLKQSVFKVKDNNIKFGFFPLICEVIILRIIVPL